MFGIELSSWLLGEMRLRRSPGGPRELSGYTSLRWQVPAARIDRKQDSHVRSRLSRARHLSVRRCARSPRATARPMPCERLVGQDSVANRAKEGTHSIANVFKRGRRGLQQPALASIVCPAGPKVDIRIELRLKSIRNLRRPSSAPSFKTALTASCNSKPSKAKDSDRAQIS